MMELLVNTLRSEFEKLLENRIKLNVIGNTDQLPEIVRNELEYVTDQTKNNTEMTLTLALLGLGGMRSFEKSKGVARESMKK